MAPWLSRRPSRADGGTLFLDEIAERPRGYLKKLLEQTGGNISRAAQIAGHYRADFYKLLKQYGPHPSSGKEKEAKPAGQVEKAGQAAGA